MNKTGYYSICNQIIKISQVVRFVGIVGKIGDLLAYERRVDLESLLDAKNTSYQFSHIAIASDLEAFFNQSLGKVEFVWEEREKVQTISFAIGENRVWVSIDKKVVRSEVLRIVDLCLPIVRNYSDNQQEE